MNVARLHKKLPRHVNPTSCCEMIMISGSVCFTSCGNRYQSNWVIKSLISSNLLLIRPANSQGTNKNVNVPNSSRIEVANNIKLLCDYNFNRRNVSIFSCKIHSTNINLDLTTMPICMDSIATQMVTKFAPKTIIKIGWTISAKLHTHLNEKNENVKCLRQFSTRTHTHLFIIEWNWINSESRLDSSIGSGSDLSQTSNSMKSFLMSSVNAVVKM